MTYLAQVINSTLREITPILLVALCAGVCSKVQVFNIALEGTLLMSAFFAFLTHYFLHNILLSVAVAMAVLCSVFMIRYVTPTALKVWDVDIYISFCFALVNIVLLVSAVLPRRVLPKLFLGLAGLALFAPILLCWGYYATELSWLNVDSLMAVLQTNAEEAMEYVKDRTGGFSVSHIYLAIFNVVLFCNV